MREIKFRGKRVDNGECVYGGISINVNIVYIIEKIFIHDVITAEVIPDTIGQFTGLFDKNGKEIYEGDIIKSINEYNGGTTIGKVYFEDLTWFGAKDYLDYINKFCLIEIIGNIHDNQDLLK